MVGTSNQSVPEMAIDHFLGDMIDMISDARMNQYNATDYIVICM